MNFDAYVLYSIETYICISQTSVYNVRTHGNTSVVHCARWIRWRFCIHITIKLRKIFQWIFKKPSLAQPRKPSLCVYIVRIAENNKSNTKTLHKNFNIEIILINLNHKFLWYTSKWRYFFLFLNIDIRIVRHSKTVFRVRNKFRSVCACVSHFEEYSHCCTSAEVFTYLTYYYQCLNCIMTFWTPELSWYKKNWDTFSREKRRIFFKKKPYDKSTSWCDVLTLHICAQKHNHAFVVGGVVWCYCNNIEHAQRQEENFIPMLYLINGATLPAPLVETFGNVMKLMDI